MLLKSVILCGGNGTRLWPASTKEKPKQFIPLFNSDDIQNSLLDLTINRVKNFSEVVLMSNKIYDSLLPSDYVKILEPESRDTAAACITAALLYPNDILLILPSDHHIPDQIKFEEYISQGLDIVSKGYICTFGINPTYPETGYGYIKISDMSIGSGFKVDSFVEKPDLEKAKSFFESKTQKYNWNSGILLFNSIDLINEAKLYCNDIYINCLNSIDIKNGNLNNNYSNIRKQSIDYAVLEKSSKIAVLPCDILWDDIGSWLCLNKYFQSKDSDNVIQVENENCLIYKDNKTNKVNDGKLLILFGCKNLGIVDVNNITLVFPLEKSQDIKNLLKKIPEKYH